MDGMIMVDGSILAGLAVALHQESLASLVAASLASLVAASLARVEEVDPVLLVMIATANGPHHQAGGVPAVAVRALENQARAAEASLANPVDPNLASLAAAALPAQVMMDGMAMAMANGIPFQDGGPSPTLPVAAPVVNLARVAVAREARDRRMDLPLARAVTVVGMAQVTGEIIMGGILMVIGGTMTGKDRAIILTDTGTSLPSHGNPAAPLPLIPNRERPNHPRVHPPPPPLRRLSMDIITTMYTNTNIPVPVPLPLPQR